MIRVVVPYTKEVLGSIVYEYQEYFFPLSIVFIFLALWIVYTIWKSENKYNGFVVGILSFFWIWIGAIYEIKYYSTINWFGLYIGYVFILQALLLLWFGFVKKQIIFIKNKISLILSLTLILCYPLVELLKGIHYFEISIIGMLPSISVVFSLLILFMNTKKRVKTLFVIPLVWLVFSLYWNYLLVFNILEISNSF